jgi:hypothetical protein
MILIRKEVWWASRDNLDAVNRKSLAVAHHNSSHIPIKVIKLRMYKTPEYATQIQERIQNFAGKSTSKTEGDWYCV